MNGIPPCIFVMHIIITDNRNRNAYYYSYHVLDWSLLVVDKRQKADLGESLYFV